MSQKKSDSKPVFNFEKAIYWFWTKWALQKIQPGNKISLPSGAHGVEYFSKCEQRYS